MKKTNIQGQVRTELGKKSSTHLRRNNQVPCELYGGEKNVHFSLDEVAFTKLINTPDVFEFVIDLDGTEYRAVLRDTQFHPVTDRLSHADFVQVFDDRPVMVKLPVSVVGTSEGVRNGGKLNILMRRIAVKGITSALPDSVEV